MKSPEDFFTLYKQSAWRKDAVAMLALYAEDAVIFDTWNRGCVSLNGEWKKIIHEWFSALGEERVKVEFEQVSIRHSENLAFASALIKYSAISPEEKVLRSMKNRISICYIKMDEEWKVSHQHMSAPVNAANLSAILDI